MVGASKILTVSYGTFSCTLEGFDDSFSTMKAIAEYFRDLAADDRYFGAEPPTPDADMLARIAEREIERRVDARFDGENVVLRAADAAPAALSQPAETPAAPQPLEEQFQTDAAAEVETQEVETKAVETEAVEPPVVAEEPVAPVQHDSAAQELDTAETPDTASEIAEETPDVQDAIDLDAPLGAVMSDTDIVADYVFDDADVDIDVDLVDEAPVASPTPTPVMHPDADSIAAKLQRIRAVVAPGDDNDDSIFVEDQHADPMETSQLDVDMAETVETADLEAQAEDAVEVDDDIDLSALMSDISGDAEPAAPEEIEEVDDNRDEITEDPVEEALVEDLQIEEAVADDTSAGRVFKVKSAALEAALAEDNVAETVEEDVDEIDTDTPHILQDDAGAEDEDLSIFTEADDDSDLSPEEEAELMAELAEVARDTETENAQDRDGAAILASLDDPEPAIDRIMEKTNDALETPESGRKREAISHLKAAVAATEADRKMRGVEEESEDQTESYREDLAQVVRPKRATAIATDRVRPSRPTSPLKLVAEQRVDTESAAPAASAAPVRPRRISKTPAVAAETDGGFAEFAESAGARELPDLLEAAAAYTAYVEGRENFTRPQVMRRAAAVAGKDGFSREDGLRSFGQLLREGKINKLNRGQFVVSEETRFRPNARIAGE